MNFPGPVTSAARRLKTVPEYLPILNPYETTDTFRPLPSPGPSHHWFFDAAAITWASLGLALTGLLLIGALALTGDLLSLTHDVDAYVGVVVAPYVVGFAAFGSLLGGFLRSPYARLAACFVPLLSLATVLWLSDYFNDLGEGEQVATYMANGLFIGGLSILPAFLCTGRAWRISMMTLPHIVTFAIGIYFARTFGL